MSDVPSFLLGLAVGAAVTLVLIGGAIAYKILKEELRIESNIRAEERAWKDKRDQRRKDEQNAKANTD